MLIVFDEIWIHEDKKKIPNVFFYFSYLIFYKCSVIWILTDLISHEQLSTTGAREIRLETTKNI